MGFLVLHSTTPEGTDEAKAIVVRIIKMLTATTEQSVTVRQALRLAPDVGYLSPVALTPSAVSATLISTTFHPLGP